MGRAESGWGCQRLNGAATTFTSPEQPQLECDEISHPSIPHCAVHVLRHELCYTEKAEQAKQHPGIKTASNPAEDNRMKQCKPKKPRANFNATNPRKRHYNPTHSYIPSRFKSTHTCRTCIGICPHAPGQQAGGHLELLGGTCTDRASQPAEGVGAAVSTKPPVSCHRCVRIAADQVGSRAFRALGGTGGRLDLRQELVQERCKRHSTVETLISDPQE